MIIDILLPTSLAFIMFSLGIGLTINDFKNISRHPKAFAVGILNQMIVLPLIAFMIISIFKLDGNLSIGIMSSVIIYYIVYFFNLLGLTEKTSLTLSISAPLIVLILFCSILLVRINEK